PFRLMMPVRPARPESRWLKLLPFPSLPRTSVMHTFRQLLATFALCLGLAVTPVHAETFHTCGTTIASLPAVISTQGVFCLTHDLNTAITSGNAITVNANNVTI